MAFIKVILLLIFCAAWLVYCEPEDERKAFADRLRPRLRYDPRRGRPLPSQRTSTRRDIPFEEEDAQEKEIERIQNEETPIGRKIRGRGQHGGRKYLYQTEANINHNIHETVVPSGLRDTSVEYNSEPVESSSTQGENGGNHDGEYQSEVKSRNLKDSVLKTNAKTKVRRLGNQERNKKMRPIPSRSSFGKSFLSQSGIEGTPTQTNVDEYEGSPKPNYPDGAERNEGLRGLSDDGVAKKNRQYALHGAEIPEVFQGPVVEDERAREGSDGIVSQVFPAVPVPSTEPGSPGFSNRHKKQPFGSEATLQPQPHSFKTHQNIFPEVWRVPDVTHDVISTEAQRQTGPSKQVEENAGLGSESRLQMNRNLNVNSNPVNTQFEQTVPFIREHERSPSYTQRTLLTPETRVSQRDDVRNSFLQPRTNVDYSITTTTPSPEWWSAERARYSFSTNQEDRISDLSHDRQETREGGTVRGSYSYSDGYYLRTVHYIADRNGYRIISDKSTPLSPDGPQVNPDGHASVRADVDGHSYDYIVHGYQLPRGRKYYAPIVVQEEYMPSRRLQ